MAQKESIDAAVLDINLAGEMVWPLAHQLQERGIPFVFLSAYSRSDIMPKDFTATPRLEKPLEGKKLIACLSAFWRRTGDPTLQQATGHSIAQQQ